MSRRSTVTMWGAIAGDIIGSVYERRRTKDPGFQPLIARAARYTDDTVLTIAVAQALLTEGDYVAGFREYYRRYPTCGYGGTFRFWALSAQPLPSYDSFGNGSAMRVSPVGWARDTLEEVLSEAEASAIVTHSHPEGIKGAQAVAGCVFLARTGSDREEIKTWVEKGIGYDLSRSVEEIRPEYRFNVACQGSVPQAIRAWYDSIDWEDAVRLAVSLGGDADTQACIAGALAEAFYGGVPDEVRRVIASRLDSFLSAKVREFEKRFMAADPTPTAESR